MNYFVYYSDDYDSEGLETFPDEAAAIKWIEDRIAFNPIERRISCYRLFCGQELTLSAVETVSKIKATRRP